MDLLYPFNPAIDLAFKRPDTVLKMADIGFNETEISPVALAGPFSLFPPWVVQGMTDELMGRAVLKNCKYGGDSTFQLRDACPK